MRFTKASRQDGTKVTTTVNELYDFLTAGSPKNLGSLATAQIMKHTRTQGARFLLEVEGVETLFYVNRAGSTLCTKSFPAGLRKPSVGRATNYAVTGVNVIINTLGVSVG